jgi:hypothetical protein
MAKGSFLTDDERNVIKEEYTIDPSAPAKELRDRVNERLSRRLALSTISAERKKLRDTGAIVRNQMNPHWQLGLLGGKDALDIPSEALPMMFKIQAELRTDSPGYNIPAAVAVWIGRLYTLVPEIIPSPKVLYVVSYAYALFEHTNLAAGIEKVDTLVLDQLIVGRDFDALITLAQELQELVDETPEAGQKDLITTVMRELSEAFKKERGETEQ